MAFSTQEFAATIKKKYPQYNEMPDDSLALLVIKKYPQYKEQVDLGTLQAKFIPQAKEYGLIDDNFQPIAKTSLSEASGGEFSFLPSVQAGLNAQPAIPGVTMAPSQRQPMPTIQDAPDINTQIQASVAGMGTTVPNTKANVMDQNWEATKLTAPDPAELSSDEVFRQGNQMQLRLAAAQKKWDEDYKAGLIPMKTVEVPGDMGRPATMSVPSIARPTENSFAFAESGVPLEQGSVQAMAGEIGTLAENVLGPVTGLVLNRKPGERRAITFNEKKLAAESIRMEKELSQKEASGIELTPEEKELKETLKPDVWESLKAMAEQVYEDPKRFIELNVPSLTAGILMAPAMDAGIAVVASRVKEAARVYKMAKVNKILRARRAERLSSAISGGKAAPVFNSPVDDIVARYGQQVGLDNARKAVADALIAGGDSRLLANSLQKMGIQTTKGQRRLLGNIGQEMAEEVGPVAFAQTVTDWGQGRGDLDAATIVTNVFASLPIAAVGGAGMGAAGAAVRSAAGSPSVGMDAPTADRVAGKMILNRQATPDGGAVPTPNYAQGVAETVGSPEFKPTAERIAKTLDNPEVSRHYEKLVPEIGGRGMDSRIEGAGEGAFVRGRMQDRGAFTIGETAYGGGKDAGIHEAIHGVERFIRSNPDSHGDVDEAIQDWKDNAYEQLRTERPDLFESLSKMTRNAREAKEELFTQSMVRSLGLQDNDWGIPMETGLTERFASYLGESEALKANKPSASNMNFDGVGDGSDAPFSVLKKNEEKQVKKEPQFKPEDEQYSVLKAGIPESRANDPKLVDAAKKAWKEKGTDSPWFKKWFGESKVVDADGKPLVVYHGTPNYGFTKFNEYSHFTQDKKYAERYMNPNASSSAKTSELMEAKNPGIYKVYLSIKNPFDTRNAESKKLFESEYLGKYGNNTPLSESGLPDWTDANDIVDWIKETGKNFDGVIVDEGGDEGGSRGISYIPLNPNQVKLAEGNNGEFSLENDDIRFSLYPRNEQQQAQKEIIKAAYAGLKKNGLHLQNGISYQDISQKWGAMPKNLDDEGKKAYRKKWDSALESLRETIQEDESTALMAGIRKSDIDEQNIQDIVWKLSDWANAMAEKPKKGDVDPETRKWLSNATPEQVAEYEKAQAAYAASGKKQKKLSRYEEKNTPPKGTSAEEFNTAEDFNPKGDPTASKKDAFGGQIAEGEQAEEWKDLVVRRIYDYLDPLKKVQKRVTGSTEGGVTHEAMLQASRAQDKVRKAKEAFLEPVRKIMERSGLTLDDVDQYLYARHALERNEQIAKVNKDFQDPENFGGSGMSNKTARAILKSFEIDQPKKFEALKRIGVINDRMNKWRLDYGRSMGILSEEEAEAYEAGYKHYVPLRGRPDEITGETVARPGISKGMQARKDEKRALGRRSLAMNVTAQNFTRTLDMIANAERNKVGLALAKMIRENPDPEYWTIDKTPMKLVFDKKTGEAKPAPDMKMDAPNEYAFYENGERHVMRFHTPEGLRLASALKGMSEQSGNTVLKVVSMLNRFVAGMVTSYSPEFVLSNASRDAMTASITSSVRDGGKVAAKTLSSAPKAAVAIMGREFGKNMGEWGKYYERFQKAGGKTAFLTMIDFNEFAENIKSDLLNAERSSANPKKVFKALITGLERVNAGVENGTRLAYFRTLTESGMSDEQAALKAKELTVNFERHGEYKWMNQLWMFMNAALQGTSNVARLFTNPKTRKAALVAASSLVSLGAMNAIFNKEFGGKDEKSEEDYWDRAKAWERDRNLIFLNPISKDGTGPKIPLPYEFSFFIRLGQELADLVYGKKAGQAALNIANSAVSAVSPLGSPISVEDGEVKNPIGIAIPTPLQPFADIERNRGFDGRPIMPEDSPFGAKKPDSQKYFKGVNPILRDATAWMNEFTGGSEFKPGKIDVSPETIEHLINAYTGGIGQLVQRVGGLGKTMTTEGEKVELRQIPFVRKFFRGDMGNDRADFKRIADLSEQSEAEYMSYLEKGQEDKANAFEDENYLLIQTARIFKESGKGVDWNSTEQKAEVTDLYKRAKRQFKRAEEIDLKLKNEGNSDRKKMYKNQIDSLLSSAWDGYMESIK